MNESHQQGDRVSLLCEEFEALWQNGARPHIEAFLSRPRSQCTVAGWVLNMSCCSWPSWCNYPVYDSELNHKAWEHHIPSHYTYFRSTLSESMLEYQLSTGPVMAGFNYGSTGHLVLVVGYEDCPGEDNYLIVHDPNPYHGTRYVLYDFLMTAFGYGHWDASWTIF